MTFECLYCARVTRAHPWLENCRDYYLQKKMIVDYYQCETCQSVQQFPLPVDSLSLYDDYPLHKKKSSLFQFLRRLILAPLFCKFFDAGAPVGASPTEGSSGGVFSPAGTAVACPPEAIILDYGCGDGGFLADIKDRYPNCIGFEPHQGQAETLSNLYKIPVYSTHQQLLEAVAGKVQVITLHMVLEHLTDIHGTFKLLSQLLLHHGMIYIVIPNLLSWEARLFKRKWHGLDAPRHISFMSAVSLQQICKKYQLTMLRQTFIPFPNTIAGSVPPVLAGRYHGLLFYLFLPFSILLARLFPSGSQGFLLARDRETGIGEVSSF